jgi:hypothetical protein
VEVAVLAIPIFSGKVDTMLSPWVGDTLQLDDHR